MPLVNDQSDEPNYISTPNSSDDLSSPENHTEVTYTGGGGGGGGGGEGASVSSSSTLNSDHHQQQHNQEFVFYPSNETIDDQDHNSLMDFNGSFLNFDHQKSFIPLSIDGNMSYGYNTSWMDSINISPRLIKTSNCFETTTNFGLTTPKPATNHGNGDWLYSDSTVVTTGLRYETASPKSAGNKRPFTGGSSQATKKLSTSNGKAKPKATTTSPKDPQSLAAKNRRERISERLKVLQELVPNGTKVDLVTMLEKAIGYVKFLQLQVKVLAADEFWPVQGGKPPDISQVKDAIDAILSTTQRERNSN